MLKASSPVQGKDHNLSWKPLHYVSPISESCPGILHDIRDSLRATSSQSTAGLRVRGALQSGQRRREKKLKWNKTLIWYDTVSAVLIAVRGWSCTWQSLNAVSYTLNVSVVCSTNFALSLCPGKIVRLVF